MDKQISKLWEIILFEEFTKLFKRNMFELVKAADFFDIPAMLDSLVVYIVKELLGKDCQEIYTHLYQNNCYLPNRFKQSVLCILLTNKVQNNLVHYKHELINNQNEISFLEKCLNKKHFSQNIEYDDFSFLYKTIGNFIKYEETNAISSLKLLYPDVKLDFSGKNKYRLFIDHFIDEEDRHETMIAGGVFSEYQNESLFARNMPDVYTLMKNNKDIDLFIYDSSKQNKFQKYYEKIYERFLETGYRQERNSLDQTTDSDKIYDGVHSFKITVLNGEKLNFIFIDKNEYPSLFSFLNTFDFTLSKIFYSYNSDAIFVPIELFSEYNRIYWKYHIFLLFPDVFADVDGLLGIEFNKYTIPLANLLKFTFDINKSDDFAYMSVRKLEFLNENKHILDNLCKCSKMFYRIVKYGFKNYFKNNDEARSCYLHVNLVYKIFKNQILNNCFTNENITDSIFSYILKKKNL